MFNRKKSIDELEEESEHLDAELDVKKKQAMLAEINKRGGQGFWKRFSSDGTKGGISWSKAIEWLRNNNKYARG